MPGKKPSKKAAVKKTAVRKPAPVKKVAAVKKQVSAKVSTRTRGGSTKTGKGVSAAPATTIVAEVDIGWGNTLFLRGQGGALSWHAGVPMDHVHGLWRWTGLVADETLQFKFLINDEHWCHGEDMHVAAGGTAHVRPRF